MTINLNSFLDGASNLGGNKLTITKKGRISIQPKKNDNFTTKWFSFLRENKEKEKTQFSHDVLRGVVQLLENGQINERVSKKVLKASTAIFNNIQEDWANLDDNDKERFFDITGQLAYELLDRRDVQEKKALDKLNLMLAHSLGADFCRAIGSGSLELLLPDGTKIAPKNLSDKKNVRKLILEICNANNISKNDKKAILAEVDSWKNVNSGEASIDRLMKNHPEFKRAVIPICNAASQNTMLHMPVILKEVFNKQIIPKIVEGSHDKIQIELDEMGNATVKHRIKYSFKDDPDAIFIANTKATLDNSTGVWSSTSISFSVTSSTLPPPRHIKTMRLKLERLGYLG